MVGLVIGPSIIIMSTTFSPSSSIDTEIIEAMQWLGKNAQPDSKVLVISDAHVKEWLPQISQRTVLNMPFGSEWQPEESLIISRMENELNACQDLDCVFSSGQMILDINQFLLFANKENLEYLTRTQNNKTEFHLLWENEKIGIGMLYKIDTYH